MQLYVHIDDSRKPYIDAFSTEQKEGYKLVSALMDSQLIALYHYPHTCYLDRSGALHAPTDIPVSEQDKQADTIAELKEQLSASQNINGILLAKLNVLSKNVDDLMQRTKGDK